MWCLHKISPPKWLICKNKHIFVSDNRCALKWPFFNGKFKNCSKNMLYDMFFYLVGTSKRLYLCAVILKTIFFTLKTNTY